MKTGNGASIRRLASWIESYVSYTKNLPAPEAFRRWTAISTIASALERRVWITTAGQTTYPNMFILLVSRPGVGKTNAMGPATKMLRKTEQFHVAPKDMTKASFLRWLADDARDQLVEKNKGGIYEYHSGILHLSELGTFIRAFELDLLSMFSDLYDCPEPSYENHRIYQGKDKITIPNPQINLLAGTQPGYLASVFPPEAWSQGFMSRMMMIYGHLAAKPDLFTKVQLDPQIESRLIADLADMKLLRGEYEFTQETQDVIGAWYDEGMKPAPEFPRLEHYCTRRIVHLLKLCMIAAASRHSKLIIEIEDFETAQEWMLSAEKSMQDVFLEMTGRSDSDTLRELWFYAWRHYVDKKKSLHRSRLTSHLIQRVPAWSAEKILQMAVQAKYFLVDKHDMFTPQPKSDWEH